MPVLLQTFLLQVNGHCSMTTEMSHLGTAGIYSQPCLKAFCRKWEKALLGLVSIIEVDGDFHMAFLSIFTLLPRTSDRSNANLGGVDNVNRCQLSFSIGKLSTHQIDCRTAFSVYCVVLKR